MVVVDSNVIAYLLLPERDETASGGEAEAARRVLARDAVWAAPDLWRSEVRNVFALYMRRGLLSLAAAQRAQAAGEAILAGREYVVESARVLALAAQSGRTAYDCEFVALAQALGVPLVTADRQVLASFPGTAVSLESFAA